METKSIDDEDLNQTVFNLLIFQLNSPIVSAWTYEGGEMKDIDLFLNSMNHDEESSAPLLYIGSYNQQLYIQQSDSFNKKLTTVFQKTIDAHLDTSSMFTLK